LAVHQFRQTAKARLKRLALDIAYRARFQGAPALTFAGEGAEYHLRTLPGKASNLLKVDGRDVRIFFMCGHPRSGTNWTKALLNLHPKIRCTGEFRFNALRRGFDQFARYEWHVAHKEPFRSISEACFQDTIRCFMAAVARRNPQATWVGDQTPRLLEPFLPGAPHFLVVRDGRDVMISIAHLALRTHGPIYSGKKADKEIGHLRKAFTADPAYFTTHPERLLENEWFARSLARDWARQAELDTIALNAMGSDGPQRGHLVIYEKLHEDVEGERRRMYEFLELDPSEAAPISSSTRTKAGHDEERPDKFFRKGVTGDWRNYFSDRTKQIFKEEAGAELIALGYEKDDTW